MEEARLAEDERRDKDTLLPDKEDKDPLPPAPEEEGRGGGRGNSSHSSEEYPPSGASSKESSIVAVSGSEARSVLALGRKETKRQTEDFRRLRAWGGGWRCGGLIRGKKG